MNKQTLLLGFGAFIILVFLLGAFSPLMYARNDSTQTATPTAAATFEGAGEGTATVAALGNELFISCNATDATALIESVDGVELAFKQTADSYAAIINGNASIPAIYAVLDGACEAAILRAATLSFDGKVTLVSLYGEETRDLHPINLEQGKAFVSAYGAEEGDEIGVVAYAQIQGDEVIRLIIEQRADELVIPTAAPESGANETFYNQTAGNTTSNESSENATQ